MFLSNGKGVLAGDPRWKMVWEKVSSQVRTGGGEEEACRATQYGRARQKRSLLCNLSALQRKSAPRPVVEEG